MSKTILSLWISHILIHKWQVTNSIH